MEPINVFEYEPLARERMEPGAWDYFMSGSDDEVSLRENSAAFARIRLRPRMLVDVSACDTRTTVLGTSVRMPILVAPAAYQRLAHPEGELATARGAAAAGTLMTISTDATTSLEEIAGASGGAPLWFQLYVYRNRKASASLVQRAEAAGYKALVLTVDAPRLGRRERDIRNGFGLPPHLRLANFGEGLTVSPVPEGGVSGIEEHARAKFDDSLTWEAVDWLRSLTSLPVLVKGILTAEDAVLAVEHGAAGVIVSNHGGRQLDSVPATIEALPEVIAAVAGRGEVYLDGGVRRGTDVLKALALGARGVLVGRPVLWGLAARGAQGVRHVLDLLREELELAMALSGKPAVAAIDRALVKLPPDW